MGQAQGGTGLHGTGGIAKNMEDNINMKTSDNCYSNLEVGKKYYHGSGVEKNYSKAAEIFRRLAELGDADAQNYLGVMYKNGQGVKKDYVKAAEWYRIAAEQGNPAGALSLAKLYDKGKGVPQDYVEAAKWYKIAAEHDIKLAQTRLGEMYEKGLGVPQDSEKAAYWTKKGVYLRSWIFNMKTLFERSNRYKRLNEMIAKVTDPKLKSSLIKTRDEYWNRIQKLNKPNFTDEDYEQIKQEHQRIDDLISKME